MPGRSSEPGAQSPGGVTTAPLPDPGPQHFSVSTASASSRFPNGQGVVYNSITSRWESPGSPLLKTPLLGGTASVTGYVGPMIGFATSAEGLAEAEYLERLEEYGDGWTPEIALKQESTYAGAVNPRKPNIESFLKSYYQIGAKKRVRGHNLIWYQGLAEWVKNYPVESALSERFREEILTYIFEVVEQVGQRVDSWDVVNELTNAGKLRESIYTKMFGNSLVISPENPVMKFYAECFKVAHEANPYALLFANEYEIETAFNYEAGQRGTVFLELIKVLQELGAPIGGVGMEFHTNTNRLVTIAEIQAIVPKYTAKGLAVEFTEFDCIIKGGTETEERQGEIYESMINGAKKAGIGRVTIWGLTDKRSWLIKSWEEETKKVASESEGPKPLPFGWKGQIKPAWRALARVRPEQPAIGPWNALKLSAKVKRQAGKQIPAIRQNGESANFKGVIVAIEAVPAGTEIAKIEQTSLRPPEAIELTGGGSGGAFVIKIATTGVITASVELAAEKTLCLDGEQYNLS